jgi:uncharacterized protein (TIGR01777 family)
MKVVIAGGSGYIGRALTHSLLSHGHEVVVLTRDPRKSAARLTAAARAMVWDARDPTGAWTSQLRGSGAVVNLAGASIGGGRWTRTRKRALLLSRVVSTDGLVRAMGALAAEDRPRVFVGASGIDYYGDRSADEPLDEHAAPGASFLARLCVQWEDAARKAEPLGVRVVCMRTALCIGRGADALRMLVLPFRLFAGGPLGSGRQWFTWIHIEDLVNLYVLAVEAADLAGPLNAVAPDALLQRDLAREIGRVLHRPALLPAPEFMLRVVLGEMADLVLHGRKAVPGRPLALGYQFHYPEVGPALRDVLAGAVS